ncbi:ribbon-helix-helix protein, CopG family [Nonomuraea sp. PA05]|uniref:CopG family ribbon-helix-helix protein n=1 Tax=Nonomuraea sp. PA05 TaxID=2604466 RepID=UPI0011D570A4|nr:ribbon-helix-helix protein, CopG family [Nonomuraea sp. PA05]
MPTDNYTLRLDSDRRRQLQEIADDQDRDMSYIIRKAIDEYIDRHKKSPGSHETGGTPQRQAGTRPAKTE